MTPSTPRSFLLPAMLLVTVVAPLPFGSSSNPGVVTAVAATGAVVLALLAVVSAPRPVSRRTFSVVALAAALALWLAIAALRSGDARISYMGTVAQHAGAALWVVSAAWIAAFALLAQKRSLRAMLAVVSVTGAVFGLMGIVEALASGNRGWGSAAGPFENSSSLAAYLAVSLLSCWAWGLTSRRADTRIVSVACAVVALMGLTATESRAGLFGAVVGLGLTGLYTLRYPRRDLRIAVSILMPLTGLLITAGLLAAASGAFGEGALRQVNRLGTDRDAIWRSAVAQLAQAPTAGSGPEQFSAWVNWSFSDGLLRYNGTYDPHNALVSIALGGGAIAAALWLAFAATATASALRTLDVTGRPRALAAVAAVPGALMASALFTWLAPAAALVTAALTGALLAVEDEADRSAQPLAPRPAVLATTGLLAVGCAVAAWLSFPMLSAERAFTGITQGDAGAYARLYERWPDPAYATSALDALSSGAGADAILSRLAVPASQPRYHVDLALRRVFLAQDALRTDPTAWSRFTAAISEGVIADPASALWFTVGAVQADALERPHERDDFARRALELRPGPNESAYLEGLMTPDQ